jgi:hypothetical protein
MKLSYKGTVLAAAITWGAAMLFIGLMNLASGSYGAEFLQMMDGLYPGFEYVPEGSFWQVIVGTLYGMVDGAVAALVFTFLYNLCRCKACAASVEAEAKPE